MSRDAGFAFHDEHFRAIAEPGIGGHFHDKSMTSSTGGRRQRLRGIQAEP